MDLICIGTVYPVDAGPEGVPCRARCTGSDDYCDACRLLDAGHNVQSIFCGFSGILANLEAMRAAGDAAGISAVMTDMENVMQRVRAMHGDVLPYPKLRVA